MRVPSRIRVSGHWFDVKYVEAVTDGGGEDAYGDTLVQECVIRISTSRNRSAAALWKTILHETTHAILGVAGWGQIMKSVGDTYEEGLAELMEHGLLPLVIFNEKSPAIRWREITFPWETKAKGIDEEVT